MDVHADPGVVELWLRFRFRLFTLQQRLVYVVLIKAYNVEHQHVRCFLFPKIVTLMSMQFYMISSANRCA